MGRVVSRDGTSIAYAREGSGPAVILVGGGLDDGSENAPLMPELATHFTVYNYARRGRGDSGDTPPFAVEREIEDIEALIAEAGGTADLYGASSGGMLALEAAAAGLTIGKVAVYDVPYDTADDAPQRYRAYAEQLAVVLAEGRRGDAVELFMRLVGSSDEEIAAGRNSPYWAAAEALAHTLAYDAALYGPPPRARLATMRQPALVITGDALLGSDTGGLGPDFFAQAADVVTACIPNAQRRTIPGQSHVPDPKVLAAVLEPFFQA
ncbi:alpha/beta fold hydrolase [Nonomuraea sp. M3C6]|uniref:Alpha/beta fold hydrolase n=1 Tax=Nonomuraea marmarensis TaxID=3351344 RepID=A0ABW7AUM4_9ACTN